MNVNERLNLLFALLLITLTACGEVVTPEPTVVSEESPTSTSAPLSTPTPRPTATAPLLPPAPTATQTVTPTPFVHTVQQGETLQGIAFDYGVSVDALQKVNGIDNPLLLQVGQRLVIPTGEETTEVSPGLLLPTPTPHPIKKQGIAFYETPVGGLWAMGEIVNTSPITLTNVQVQVRLLDSAGEMLTEADTFAAAELIPPGTQSPFGILFTAPPPSWANYQVTIIRGQEAGGLVDSYVPLTVKEVEGRPSGSQFRVSGLVQNASTDKVAGHAAVIVTTYDVQGLVTGFRQNTVETNGPLASGGVAPFSMLFAFYGDAPADFNIIALGRVPE